MNIRPRSQWGAVPATRVTPLSLPVRLVVIHHGVSSGLNPAADIKSYQTVHMQHRGWSDIAYNLLVDLYGYAWEGRGWGRVGGATGSPQDSYSISICAVGNLEANTAPDALVQAIAAVIVHGITAGHLTRDVEIIGHRDKPFATACPGKHLYARLPEIRELVRKAINDDEDEDDMSLTVTNLRNGEAAYRNGEPWAIKFVQQVLSLPAVGTYAGPKNGEMTAVLDQAVADAKRVLLGREDASPTMGADLWRAIVAQGANLPLEPAIVEVPKNAEAVKTLEAELAACRGVVAAQKLAIRRAGEALAEAP